jgi:hypothetical protein
VGELVGRLTMRDAWLLSAWFRPIRTSSGLDGPGKLPGVAAGAEGSAATAEPQGSRNDAPACSYRGDGVPRPTVVGEGRGRPPSGGSISIGGVVASQGGNLLMIDPFVG